jgi:flavin-dependent dehydrogenase
MQAAKPTGLRAEEDSRSAAAAHLHQSCDALVIGGGPAGSTMAAFLSQMGWKVTLLEKERHPRFHIGESLLPLNVPIFDRLGVREKIENIGLLKPGAEFHYEGYRPVTYYFRNAMDKSFPIAYQVRRSEFDHTLLRNAASKGADVREGVKVTKVDFRVDRPALVRAVDEAGSERLWEARFVVDASGRDTFLANRLQIKRRNPVHNSSAIFGHFEGAERRPGADAGNISIYWFKHGWYWMIPLADGAMSVGAVCWPYYLKSRRKGVTEFFMDTLALNPLVTARLKNARLIAPAMATGNFSYQAERMGGENYLIIGDAFAFIDPVFSSGVFLAMNSAELGAGLVDEALRNGGKLSPASLARYERTLRRGLKTFSWFIYRITTPALRAMFMSPRNAFRMEEAILSLLSADIFRTTPIGFPLFVFKTIYYVSSLINWRESLASYRQRRQAWRSRLEYTWKSDVQADTGEAGPPS